MCILLVDDQSSYVDLLKDAFGSHTELLYARDGLAALKLAAARVPDLILLDVIMAGIDGYEVFNRLKADPITSQHSRHFSHWPGECCRGNQGPGDGSLRLCDQAYQSGGGSYAGDSPD